jgi:dipeptidase D
MARDEPLDPALLGLEPAELWRQFDALRRIPRASMREAGVRAYLRSLAERSGWTWAEDAAGNIVLRVPGRGRGIGAEMLAIQAHMDMVCEKLDEVEHDFERDPILLRRARRSFDGREREVLQARGTTLGSDNGIGCAAALALGLTPGLEHPPLELLFTADEEQGMSGAFSLDPSLLTARRLLNLDAEVEGRIYLSCAGGRELHAVWALERGAALDHEVPVRIAVLGLRGGHSGVDIQLGRANAIVVLIELLTAAELDLDGVRLARLDGGGRPNAIPRTAEAVLWCPRARLDELARAFAVARVRLAEAYADVDPDMRLEFEALEDRRELPGPISASVGRAILAALRDQADGVLEWSSVIPGLVETSNNLGALATGPDALRLVAMARSSKRGALEAFQDHCMQRLAGSGATIEYAHAFPGWEARTDTALLRAAQASYAALFGREVALEAIHAGLECGVLHDRVPGLEMIAFGPDIHDAHTPSESLVLDTVEPFWRFVVRLAADLV